LVDNRGGLLEGCEDVHALKVVVVSEHLFDRPAASGSTHRPEPTVAYDQFERSFAPRPDFVVMTATAH